MTVNLEGEAAEWVEQLHNKDVPELGNIDTFLQELRTRFKDDPETLQAEVEICMHKKRGRPAKEYVREFRRVAGKLQQWPECLLIYYFKEGLDRELFHACIYRGVPDWIHDWQQMVVALDIELKQYKRRGAPE